MPALSVERSHKCPLCTGVKLVLCCKRYCEMRRRHFECYISTRRQIPPLLARDLNIYYTTPFISLWRHQGLCICQSPLQAAVLYTRMKQNVEVGNWQQRLFHSRVIYNLLHPAHCQLQIKFSIAKKSSIVCVEMKSGFVQSEVSLMIKQIYTAKVFCW